MSAFADRFVGCGCLPTRLSEFDREHFFSLTRADVEAMELALFIKARLDDGMTQAEIARRLGKSRGFVSKHAALIDAPTVVVDALRSGRLAGVNEAYELGNLHAAHPQVVEQWVARQHEIPRSAIVELRERLEAAIAQPEVAPAAGQTANVAPPAPAPATGVKTPDAPATAKAAPAR
jgi:ParB family chromosome partitioning protein